MQNTFYKNLLYYGVNLESLYDEAGSLIAEKLIQLFPNVNSFSFVLGLAGNATDGAFTALHLSSKNKNFKIKVFLVGRQNKIESKILSESIKKIKDQENIEFYNDCYAKDIKQSDVNVEALVGTGFEGKKLNKRFYDVIKRISHFQNKIVAIDIPAPHYTPDVTLSLNYPKTYDAEVIKLSQCTEYMPFVGPGDLEELWDPNDKSHKNKNGKLLWIGNNEENYELCQRLAQDYLVKTAGFLINKNSSSISFELISNPDKLSNDIEKFFMWADHVVIDKLTIKSYILDLFIHDISEKYHSKMTSFISLENIGSITKICVNDDKVIANSKISMKSLSIKYPESVFVHLDNRILIFNNEDMKYLNINTNYNSNLKIGFVYQMSIYATKNPAWTAARAALSILAL